MIRVEDWDGKTVDVVICGSMDTVIKKMQVRPNLIVTSPPYSVNIIASQGGTAEKRVKTRRVKYDSVKDSFSEEDFKHWLKLCRECADLVFWNIRDRGVGSFGTNEAFGRIVWSKTNGTIPFALNGVIYAHEFIYLFGDPKKIKNPIYSVWSMPAQRGSKHPAPFPVELPAKAIHAATSKGDLVFDPFGGSGTTAAVAKAMGRHWLTCDISEQYCEWIDERMKQTVVID